MTKEEIDNIIVEIMVKDGPDGHCDGHEIITSFIIALRAGFAKDWIEVYKKEKKIK